MGFLETLKNFYLHIFEKYKWVFFIIFAIAIVRYGYLGYQEAMGCSEDMQWYPARQFWGLGSFVESINPYIAYLNGDTFLSQGPNYAPMLYVLMYPLALLDFQGAKMAFAILNFACFFGTLWVFYKHKLPLAFVLSLAIVFLGGYPFGNIFRNGQIGMILGFLISVAYCYRKNPWILTLALSVIFVKYTFGIPLFLAFFLAGYYREVLLAGCINLAFVLLFAWHFDMGVLQTLLLMPQVSTSATPIGPADLMSLSRLIFGKNLFFISNPFLWAIIGLYVVYISRVLYAPPPNSLWVSSSLLLSLGTLYHLGYDHYMLFIAILIAKDVLRAKNFWLLYLVGLSVFFWYGNRLFMRADFKALLHMPQELFWSMNMGIPFTTIVSMTLIIGAFGLLFAHRGCKNHSVAR
ncbi:hypothetical protein BKH46_00310 [Helicobacter sp. 12S02634-8]|uniref:glycosyltransferase family 87 protein n=1 Tax=Helicobacter sp. 12S02634-8 TaxID=1476199 RepID=UPI000BA56D05|nr:glycosyltransferase family 87 protein [Helicobacter sp. 12S02634-8]PAF48391.1 hypothetical protein BKH46_00310 [Helicobacter sp. 12S02634-8]